MLGQIVRGTTRHAAGYFRVKVGEVSKHRRKDYESEPLHLDPAIIRKWTLRGWERFVYLIPVPLLSVAGTLVGVEKLFIEAAMFFLVAALFLHVAFRSAVALTSNALMIRNVMTWRKIPLTHIQSVEVGYFGLIVGYSSGRAWVGLAVSKSNLSFWLRRRSRGDDVVDSILTAVAAVRTATGSKNE
ncbi:hypothetical protein ACPCAB_12635 [Streptomyces koyangensis]|uniref:hypothetical protein n=1 Tax=Streptomyces koyangensis TaxID=188770 RepID=UPI003C2F799A